MLDVLSDTYKIATRMEAFEAPRIDLTYRPLPHRPISRTAWLWRGIRWVAARFRAWQDRARAREHALRMSEHQLRDIGLSREDLLRGIDAGR